MIIRTFDEDENNVVKVWTPERIADVKSHKTIGGFDTGTLDISEHDAKLYNITELEYDAVMYVDNAMSICRNTSGWDAISCEGHVKDRILYRCFFCHQREQDKYCKGITSVGRRCSQVSDNYSQGKSSKSYSDIDDYCRYHTSQLREEGWKFDLENMKNYLDKHQYETVMLWKRSLLQRLRLVEEIGIGQLMSINRVLTEIREGTRSPRSLPTKTNTYFMWCDGYVKIGHSKDPEKRFRDLVRDGDATIRPKGVNMENAKMLGWVAGSVYIEGYLHKSFRGATKWVAGEWFNYDSEAALLIDMVLSGSSEFSVGHLVEDLVKNYDVIIDHDVQGGFDYKTDHDYFDELRKTFSLSAMNDREETRIQKYGF